VVPGQAAPAQINFFRNFNRMVGLAFVAIMLLTLGFLAQQVRQKHQEELTVIQAHVARHSQFIEFVLRSSMDYLETLRLAASHADAQPVQGQPRQPLRALLHARDEGTRFDLDDLPDRDSGANITGMDGLQGRSNAFERDLTMAFGLNQTFFSILFNLPSAAQSGFVSVEQFAAFSPWRESAKLRFEPALYERPLWRLGTPAHNPNREKYWVPVRDGGPSLGLLVGAGAPVYRGDDFRGVVSIDTSLDYLNRINTDFDYPLGTVMLVDAYGAVLAHPDLVKNALAEPSVHSLPDMLPPDLTLSNRDLQALPLNQPVQVGGYWVIQHRFISAPWRLVYLVPQQALWQRLLQERALAMLAMLLGLASLMVVMYVVTAREFVVPATKLVQHLALESHFQPQPVPKVPFPWRPWFATVSKAFRESLQLASIRQELDIAAQMQRAILPHTWPQQQQFQLWGTMRPAKEVGGDFYDHFALADGSLGIVVADVSGKGVPAALFGMVSKTLFRATATQSGASSAPDITASVNNGLCQDNDSCMFVTVFYAQWKPDSGELIYVNGGHPPPLWLHADGHAEFLPTTEGMALGVFDGVPFASHRVQLAPGDCVLMYTDGVTEAFNTAQEEFGPQRLLQLYAQAPVADVQEAVNRALLVVEQFTMGEAQSDDITCVALRFGPIAPVTRGAA
jgi:sigma-B regulation protein RsbU (phosphoserine phosphatase)